MSSTSAPEPPTSTSSVRRRPRLLRRLTALYSGIASLVLLFAALAVYQELVGDLDREDDVLLRENALLVDALLLRPDREPQRSLLALDENRKRLGARRMLVRVIDGAGSVLVETPGMSGELPTAVFPPARDPDQESLHGEDHEIGGRRYRLATASLHSTALGGSEAAVQLAMDRAVDDVLTVRYRDLLLLVVVPTSCRVPCSGTGWPGGPSLRSRQRHRACAPSTRTRCTRVSPTTTSSTSCTR